jgi:transglutaminase-like putative cysteine protease
MIVPFLVPGFGSKAILDISSTNASDRIRIDPLVSIKASLTRKDPVEVFQVRSDTPSYWRMLALTTFDGDTWRPDLIDPGEAVTSGTILSAATEGSEPIEQTFTVSSDLGFPWLPVAYPPQQIDIADTTARYNSSNGTVTLDDELDAGAEYHATSVRVQPTPAQLAAVVFPPPAQSVPTTSLGDVPPDVAGGIRAIADRWTEGAANDYQRVLAIQDHLSDDTEFTYDKSVPARDDSYTLLEFLTSTKRGFCQQFASAMAVMLRTLGFPSRVAIGYTSGQQDPDTQMWHVSTTELHSWVEVLFPTYGWLAFEPTPGRQNPVANEYQHPSVSCPPGTPGCSASDGGAGTDVPGTVGNANGLPPQLQNVARREFPGGGLPLTALPPDEAVGEGGWHVPAGLVILLLLALCLVAALTVPPVRALRRRARLHKAGREPRALILATYDVFAERAADLGHPKTPGETLEEFRRRLSAGGSFTDGHLDRLTSITGKAAYAPTEPAAADVLEASEAANTVLHELRDRTPIGRRIAGQYRLRR